MTSFKLDRRALMMALPALALTPRAFAGEQQAMPPTVTPTTTVEPDEEMSEAGKALKAWLDEFGRPTAKVMLNGQGPFDFMVDTGANSTVVAMRHALAVGAPFTGMTRVHGTTGSTELAVAQISNLETGAVDRTDVRVAVIPDHLLDCDGILGANIFVGKRLYFDIPAKRVRVENSRTANGHSIGRTGTRLQTYGQLELRDGMLAQINGRVGRVPTKLMLDTGAQNCICNLALSRALTNMHPRLNRVSRVKVSGVTGQIIVGDFIELPTVAMGKMTIRDGGAVAADAPIFELWDLVDEPAMIVGVDILSRLQGFSIDYGMRRFEAKPLAALMAQGSASFT